LAVVSEVSVPGHLAPLLLGLCVMQQSIMLGACGRGGCLAHGGQEADSTENEVVVAGFLLLLLSFPLGPNLLDGVPHIQGGCSPIDYCPTCQSSLKTLSQTHPEVSFPNLLGISQSNKVDNQD
jgi:hypothetical protein